jgi:EAL domain-containing protein (putative c-di-GMP-specific phosphodiesterase class I)
VLREAIAIAARSHRSLFTAVNLSPVQLRDEKFADRALALCRSAGVEPVRIELEITEQVLMEDCGTIRYSLEQLRAAGFRLALDDFGTGYSSLSYLRQFTVDKIKIDRSFVADVCGSEDARAIIAAIVTLGQALGLTVAAEGVETEQQADLLRMAGCDQLQGHFFAHPSKLVQSTVRSGAHAPS